ncbi:polyprenol phosphomannose-dependent alpha 1,6 mannosyltransferase MptB [Arthrobacter cryoconiti]|uniref:Polyprenol phosphomannose-dependent alpha 1,6 mannosyltransferase MptB n=1 Tax=Arthrobacter cryoconiti TaxID=748907 RepID=A0ABV8R0J8_9MICC|nr:polyprenol phosphomannose-dependent alpha 1,6 mannosyltransferase MptB [Arthrobacter cryoconiti]MCC9069869.1 polyprenol phosphomannose-dependent alpha 1,6 mannosyltransferase MptB [Arthrobacter cryoconiti]
MSSSDVAQRETRSQVSTKVPARYSGAQKAVWQGFAGSVLLLLGSFGVGWLASSSSLIRTPLFIVARTTPAAVIITTVMLCIGALLMLRAWLRLRQHLGAWDGTARPILRKALILWAAPMMLALPLFSRDSYAYIGQGRLMQQGLNPYTNGISALSNYFFLGSDTLWTEAPTPYGPVWLWLEQGAVALSNGSPELALIPFRLASLLGVVLLFVYIPKLAARHGLNPDRTLWLVVLNPVLLINFIASVHNDSLMLGLVVAGIYYASAKRPILGIVLVTLSIAIKPITLIALPFVGLLWAGSRAGWSKKFLLWGATLVISMGLMAAMGMVNGLGFGWLAALQTPGAVWIWYAPVGLFSHAVGFAVSMFGGSGAGVTAVLQGICQGASILLVVALALARIRPVRKISTVQGGSGAREGSLGVAVANSTSEPFSDSHSGAYSQLVLRRMAWAFAAVVLLAPMIQPWYMLWLLAFFAMTGIKDGVALRGVYYLSVFFTLIALTDQLSIFQWIPVIAVRAVAIGVGVFGAVWIIFWDRKTRVLFSPSRARLDALSDSSTEALDNSPKSGV